MLRISKLSLNFVCVQWSIDQKSSGRTTKNGYFNLEDFIILSFHFFSFHFCSRLPNGMLSNCLKNAEHRGRS